MAQETIDRLIVNSPYERTRRGIGVTTGQTRLFDLAEGRRPAGYVVASQDSKAFDDPGTFVEIPLVNQIRARVKKWRDAGYPGVTGASLAVCSSTGQIRRNSPNGGSSFARSRPPKR